MKSKSLALTIVLVLFSGSVISQGCLDKQASQTRLKNHLDELTIPLQKISLLSLSDITSDRCIHGSNDLEIGQMDFYTAIDQGLFWHRSGVEVVDSMEFVADISRSALSVLAKLELSDSFDSYLIKESIDTSSGAIEILYLINLNGSDFHCCQVSYRNRESLRTISLLDTDEVITFGINNSEWVINSDGELEFKKVDEVLEKISVGTINLKTGAFSPEM